MSFRERVPQPLIRQFGGLNVRDSELGLPGNDSPFMLNVDLHPPGSIRMRNGTTALTTPTNEWKISALARCNQPDTIAGSPRGWVYMIANTLTAGGTIYRTAEPAVWSWETPTHASGYTLAAQTIYGWANGRYYDEGGATEYPSVLYLPRSNGVPLIALGQTSPTGDIITMPAGSYLSGGTRGYPSTWTTNHYPTRMRMISHGNATIGTEPEGTGTISSSLSGRMHAWGMANAKNRVYYSELGVPYNFLRNNVATPAADPAPEIDGGWYDVERGDGDEITAVVGLYGYTVVFKRNRTFIFSGDPGIDWTLSGVLPVGCVGDRAWVKAGNDIFFWAVDGPRRFSTVQEYGDLAHTDIGYKTKPNTVRIQPSAVEHVRCIHDHENMRVVWFVPETETTHNDTAYAYYYNTGVWTKWTGEGCSVLDVLTIQAHNTARQYHIGGTYAAGVVKFMQGFTDAYYSGGLDEADIVSDYYTNWLNLGELSDVARVLWLDVLEGDEGGQVNIYYQTDLNAAWIPVTRILRSFGATGTKWGYFQWGSSAWGTTGRGYTRYEIDDLFNFIRFRFAVTGSYGFEIMGYRLEAHMKGPLA